MNCQVPFRYVSTGPLIRARPSVPCESRRTYPTSRSSLTSHGRFTPYSLSDPAIYPSSKASLPPFYFETGYALYAKRPSRPFPPPFVSLPTTSFSDPLTTHTHSRDRRPHVNGQLIRGITNGDDAIIVSRNFLGVNDGVGAWANKERGHAALWSRLIAHFWDAAVEKGILEDRPVNPVESLQEAYESTIQVTGGAKGILGTTTVVSAFLHWKCGADNTSAPVLYSTNMGDCKVIVIRPGKEELVFQTKEQWHWFDCPKQLGSNSKDTPRNDAICNAIDIQEGDLVLAVSDGVTDNLWENEISTTVLEALEQTAATTAAGQANIDEENREMVDVAVALRNAAKVVAEDPFAESPYMERAVDEGLTIEGGEYELISAMCCVALT